MGERIDRSAWNARQMYEDKMRKRKALQQQHNASHMLQGLQGEVPAPVQWKHTLGQMVEEGGKAATLHESPGKQQAIETFGTQAYIVFDAFEHHRKNQ